MAVQSFQLVMRDGPAPGKIFSLSKEELFLGRDISNDIVVNDAEVSRKHARLLLQAGQYVVEDLGSTNGTFINDERISGPHILSAGEVIQFGENVIMVYEASQYDADATVAVAAKDIPAEAPEMEAEAAEEAVADVIPEPVAAVVAEPVAEVAAEPVAAVDMPAGMENQDPSETFQEASPFFNPDEADDMAEAAPDDKRRKMIIGGCGCLLLIAWLLWAQVPTTPSISKFESLK